MSNARPNCFLKIEYYKLSIAYFNITSVPMAICYDSGIKKVV